MNTSASDEKNKPPMKLSEYRSSGRELHVFKAEAPDGLLGVHAGLVASALKPGERLCYLLYAPIREAGNAPFGIQAEPASHAVALTDHRFLISKNRHINLVAPTVQDIPFPHVICIEIGSALLLGWFAVHFIEQGRLSCTSLFYTARGSHHFEAIVREFRKMHRKSQNCLPSREITWTDVWEQTPKPQTAILKSLILAEENPVYLFRSTETWIKGKRRHKQVCCAAEGRLLATDWGLLHAVDEQPIAPDILSYGVNVRCIFPGALYSIDHVKKEEHGIYQHILRLHAGKPPAIMDIDVPVDGNTYESVADFVRAMQEMKR